MRKGKQPEEILVKRIEPLSWWIGMKTPLQLMIYGKNLAGATLSVQRKGVKVKKLHKAESPDYLFADIEIAPTTQAGKCIFELKKKEKVIRFEYLLEKRHRDSASRKSFSPADMIYLVLPDRFANGDPGNDTIAGLNEKSNRKDPFGRHGGDLQGVIDHLDYMVDLGVTTLWLTPPQLDNESKQSYHGYACSDYYHVDPRFGDNELYRQLVVEAHWRELKVIMDAVPNHCSLTHWWMEDLPFWNWVHQHPEFIRSNYRLVSVMDPNGATVDQRDTVDGWFDDSMVDMALENPYVVQYFLQAYIWWIEWADLDGLRVDTFPYNDRLGIAQWTKGILTEYPNLNIVAECWHSSPAVVSYWQANAPNKDGYSSHLPSVMDFPLRDALEAGLAVDCVDWMGGMNRIYEALALDFLYPDPHSLLIFLDNHDTDRFADSMKGNKDKIKMGLTMLATLRGIPQLYYGTEYGFRSVNMASGHGGARRDFPGGWRKDRKDLFTGEGATLHEKEIFEHASVLFNWRKNATVIHTGKMKHFLPRSNVYVYFRYTENESVMVLLNPTRKDREVDWDRLSESLQGYSKGKELFTGEEVRIGEPFKVKAHQSLIIEMKKDSPPKPKRIRSEVKSEKPKVKSRGGNTTRKKN